MINHEFICGEPNFPVTVTLMQPAAIADFHNQPRRPLVILLPGGGYRFYSDRENEIVAFQYLAQGFTVAVVQYRLITAPPVLPTALIQLGMVVAEFHRHAADYGISSDHILLAGFSAGGHLAALYADLWPLLGWDCHVATTDLKIDALALAYPVIGLRLGWPTDEATRAAITANWPAHEADQLVTSQNPPTFIWTTADDETVPAVNTECYTAALRQNRVSVTSKIYPHGPHGLSLARAVTAFPREFDPTLGERFIRPDVAKWFTNEMAWLGELWHLDEFWLNQG
ncbi:alpha/beta hydrolase [Levilactobacillus yonginensis]|uniref:alpha/beta hydrolase n=1 Tax=Levilactobacillus yonginensis TaxID=1054041 RepID=UPI00345DD6A8